MDTVSNTSTVVREVLALKKGSSVFQESDEQEHPRKKSKLEVFKDDSAESNGSILQSIFGTGTGAERDLQLNPVRQRVKENIISASTWKGQILKQRVVTPPSSSKIPVFCDEQQPQIETKNCSYWTTKAELVLYWKQLERNQKRYLSIWTLCTLMN